jgi:hypothetical protein
MNSGLGTDFGEIGFGSRTLHINWKAKPVTAILARATALWLSVFAPAAWAQPSDEKPEKAFWPREVKISEDIKLEQFVEDRERRLSRYSKIWAARVGRYEAASVPGIEISQVVNNGCLVRVLNDDNHKSIFLELTGPDLAKDQRYKVRAERSGIFKYTTVLGAPTTVERWTPVAKP